MSVLTARDLLALHPPARDALLAARAHRVPGDRGTREQLEALLHSRGLPRYEALFAVEAALGGVELPDPSGDTALGTYGLLTHQLPEARPGWATFEFGGEVLVWVAATSATVLYAQRDGAIVEVDFYGGGACVVASDLAHWLGHAVIATRTYEAGLVAGERFDGAVGQAIADALGVPLDAEVSDAYRRWWHTADWSIDEGRYPVSLGVETLVYGRSEAALDRARALIAG